MNHQDAEDLPEKQNKLGNAMYTPVVLEQMLDEHEQFIDSNGEAGQPADFTNAQLAWAQLSERNLYEAEFEGAGLQWANLKKSFLKRARMADADLQGAELQKADLRFANLTGADLRDTNLTGADLQQSSLRQARLEGANFRLVNLQQAELSGTNLDEMEIDAVKFIACDLEDASFKSACFSDCNLTGARLNRANLASANLSEQTMTKAKLEQACLSSANLTGSVLEGAILRHADLSAANLQQSRLPDADLEGASMQKADFRGADLRGVQMCHADLTGADFRGAGLEYANLSNATLRGARFDDADLHGADLSRAELSKACLCRANMHKADLSGARLVAADMTKADLSEAVLFKTRLMNATISGAHLIKADLREADLRAAKLKGAFLTESKLLNATLRETDLQDAHLMGTTGLRISQLAGANVLNAQLPEQILKFESLTMIQEACKNTRKIFLTMLLASLYASLTVLTTTDINLMLNQISSPLPIIRDTVPILWFYWAVPFFLWGLYLYFNISMQRIWESLSHMPAVFTDGLSLEKKAYPWLLLGIINAHFRLLKEQRPSLWVLQNIIAAYLAWCVVPATLLLFWIKYLPQHSWPCTIFHVLMLTGSLVSGFLFYRLTGKTLRWENKKMTRRRLLRCSLATLAVISLLFILSTGAINGRHTDSPAWETLPSYSLKKAVPYLFRFLGVSPFAELSGNDVSLKPENWMIEDTGYKQVIGVNLSGRNLAGARAREAFFAKADLQHAHLAGADFSKANLRGADLRDANLRGTEFTDADLTGADLRGADFKDANLHGAILSRANLSNARNITFDQLSRAMTDNLATEKRPRINP